MSGVMADDLVLLDSHANGVVALRLNRPPMNALSQALLGAIGDAAESLRLHTEMTALAGPLAEAEEQWCQLQEEIEEVG